MIVKYFFIIVLLLLYYYYFLYGYGDLPMEKSKPIIINFCRGKRGSANIIMDKNYYSAAEFRKKLETLLITVFGRWSLNFKYSGAFGEKESKFYCEGLLSSIFRYKPRFEVWNTDPKNKDFLRGLEKNIDAEQYLGFYDTRTLDGYKYSGEMFGLLNIDLRHPAAAIYLAKMFGRCYEDKKYFYAPMHDFYVKYLRTNESRKWKLNDEERDYLEDFGDFKYFMPDGTETMPASIDLKTGPKGLKYVGCDREKPDLPEIRVEGFWHNLVPTFTACAHGLIYCGEISDNEYIFSIMNFRAEIGGFVVKRVGNNLIYDPENRNNPELLQKAETMLKKIMADKGVKLIKRPTQLD
jgi:hypothetical protein